MRARGANALACSPGALGARRRTGDFHFSKFGLELFGAACPLLGAASGLLYVGSFAFFYLRRSRMCATIPRTISLAKR